MLEAAGSEAEGENNNFDDVEAGESCRNNLAEGRMSGVMLTLAVVMVAGEEGSTVVDGRWVFLVLLLLLLLLLLIARGSVVILQLLQLLLLSQQDFHFHFCLRNLLFVFHLLRLPSFHFCMGNDLAHGPAHYSPTSREEGPDEQRPASCNPFRP